MDTQSYIQKAGAIIRKHLTEQSFIIFLFGSRANGSTSPMSDIDIGIQGDTPVPLSTLGIIKEDIEQSNIPFFVDVVDFSRVSQSFREMASANTVTL